MMDRKILVSVSGVAFMALVASGCSGDLSSLAESGGHGLQIGYKAPEPEWGGIGGLVSVSASYICPSSGKQDWVFRLSAGVGEGGEGGADTSLFLGDISAGARLRMHQDEDLLVAMTAGVAFVDVDYRAGALEESDRGLGVFLGMDFQFSGSIITFRFGYAEMDGVLIPDELGWNEIAVGYVQHF